MFEKGPSKPISRVLFSDEVRAVTIYLAPMLPSGSSDLPEETGRASLCPPVWSCSEGGLPATDVTIGAVSSYLAISPLPAPAIYSTYLILRFHIPCSLIAGRWWYVSVALSVGSPLLGVTQPSARWSSDFPPPDIIGERSPSLLGPIEVYYKASHKSNGDLSGAAVPHRHRLILTMSQFRALLSARLAKPCAALFSLPGT